MSEPRAALVRGATVPGKAGRSTDGSSADPPRYRPAQVEDLPACTRVWRAALADYLGRLNADDGLPFDLEPLRRLLAHLLATDPGRYWVAVRSASELGDDRAAPGDGGAGGERIVGFGAATVRGDTWFLAMLFVDPVEQGRGIGRALLERTIADTEGLALGTATDSVQPVSNALYARLGIVPRMPCLHLVGRPGPLGALPGLPPGVHAVGFEQVAGDGGVDAPGHRQLSEAVGTVDRAVLGYERPGDHAWMRRDGRLGWLYRDSTGRALGYGYLTKVGRVGPVAAVEPGLLAPLVAHLLAAHVPAGASSFWVPGDASEVVEMLLRAGFRLESFPALFCWSRRIADFGRYLPITLALV
jgi:GNAT superfamily N-acetyltransferase